MKSLFNIKSNPELQARKAIRSKKWSKALSYYEKEIKSNDRNYFLWNTLGDLQFNTKAKAQALESWRRAVEGFSSEGLHENVLGISRKILRRLPEEEDIYLLIADAYLGMEYYSDCLAAFRSYIKIAKHKSETDMKALFKKIVDANLKHSHLAEELSLLYKDSEIDDYELGQQIQVYVSSVSSVKYAGTSSTEDSEVSEASAQDASVFSQEHHLSNMEAEGLMVLDGHESFNFEKTENHENEHSNGQNNYQPDYSEEFVSNSYGLDVDGPVGDEKDHYDLGIVYRDMKLWDAAISEFEQARRDPALRIRATLAYAGCLQETHDLQSALRLLDHESENEKCSSQDRLSINFQRGVIHENLGNLSEALTCFQQVYSENDSYGDTEERIASIKEKLSQA